MNIQQLIARTLFFLLAWCALAVAPAFAQKITHLPLFTFEADSPFDSFGSSVSGVGDVNGDGVADLIVGAPFSCNNGGGCNGNARVFSGADGSIIYNFIGDSPGDEFGTSVSGAGDVNGDGVADLIVGAPFGDGNNGNDTGSVRVFSGADGSIIYNFFGDSSGDEFGTSVSDAGDVNGDGVADLIVGAPDDDSNAFNAGSVRVFSGVDGSVLHTFDGDSILDRFGTSVSGAGDVNGDGFADLIVGAPGVDSVFTGSGSARVFSGIDGSVLYNLFGDRFLSLAEFGISVSGAGDVNGDGFADLIVGGGRSNSTPRVFSGVDGSLLYTLSGNNELGLGRLGSSVSSAGDVNGDGFADVIVGNPGDVNDRNDAGIARVFSGVDGGVLFSFTGAANLDEFGSSVSGAGDLNGDGIADFIVGAAAFEFAGANSGGYARVFVSQITPAVQAEVINVDFNRSSSSFFTYSGLGAVPDAAANTIWNATVGGMPTPSGLLDSTGAATSVGLAIGAPSAFDSFSFGFGFGFPFPDGDHEITTHTELFADYVFSTASDSGADLQTSTINGLIPGNSYDLYIYGQGDNFEGSNSFGGQNVGVRIGTDVRHTSYDGIPGGDGLLVEDIEYVKFTGIVADADGVITFEHFNPGVGIHGTDPAFADSSTGSFDLDNNNSRFHAMNGLQIVGDFPPLLKGDVDTDGDVDFDDIVPFIAVLQAGVFQAEADCDCNTVVDFADIPAFIAILQAQ